MKVLMCSVILGPFGGNSVGLLRGGVGGVGGGGHARRGGFFFFFFLAEIFSQNAM